MFEAAALVRAGREEERLVAVDFRRAPVEELGEGRCLTDPVDVRVREDCQCRKDGQPAGLTHRDEGPERRRRGVVLRHDSLRSRRVKRAATPATEARIGGMASAPQTFIRTLRIVDSKPLDIAAPRYVARIRWRCDVDPDWEIDTRHPGFEAWREAACFANGLSEEGACILFLQDGALVLQLVNGRDVVVDGQDTIIWQRSNPSSSGTPDDINFVRADAGPDELSAMGLDGCFSPLRFGVDDARGLSRMDVRVEADVQRRAVLVSLAVPNEEDEREVGFFERQLVHPPQA